MHAIISGLQHEQTNKMPTTPHESMMRCATLCIPWNSLWICQGSGEAQFVDQQNMDSMHATIAHRNASLRSHNRPVAVPGCAL